MCVLADSPSSVLTAPSHTQDDTSMVATRRSNTKESGSSNNASTTATKPHPIGVAVVGSSGGGAATLGHTDAVQLLEQIQRELARCVAANTRTKNNGDDALPGPAPPTIRHALYVSLHSGKGLDHATSDDMATLYAVGCGHDKESDEGDSQSSATKKLQVRTVCTGPLVKVNEEARRLDRAYIFASVLDGSITGGMICISADPENVNKSSISAASKMGLPVTGSGGTSLSYMSANLGVHLVGNAGGSVATTTYTRAVSYVYALADAWDKNGGSKWTYSPFATSKYNGGDTDVADIGPSLRSVLDSCVPAFVAVCVTCRLLELALLWLKDRDEELTLQTKLSSGHYDLTIFEVEAVLSRLYWQLQYHALPTVCAVVAATTYAPELGSVVLMASGLASIACGGSALAGLLAGTSVAYLSKRALFGCIRMNIPATMTNVLVAGGVGCIVALSFAGCGLIHLLAQFGSVLRSIVRLSFLLLADAHSTPRPGVGFIFGMIFCYGSKVGWYHSLFLPVILIEMERGEASIFGAVDECTLCLVSAGICAGNILTSRLLADGDVSISKRGVKINLLCGDFIEAAYPFMERSVIVNAFAYLASGISTEILYCQTPEEVLSSAYLPFGLSIILAKDLRRMAFACGTAFATSFVGTMIGNVVGKKNKDE